MIEADRRLFLAGLGAALAVGRPATALAAPGGDFRMWHSPGCGCCLEWGKRIETHFKRRLPVVEAADMAAVKRANLVPPALQSCHTALIGGIVVEGHVPPEDIARLIKSGGNGFIGLAVPGMPAGSPGMDVGHNVRQFYKVHAFTARGTHKVFGSHGG